MTMPVAHASDHARLRQRSGIVQSWKVHLLRGKIFQKTLSSRLPIFPRPPRVHSDVTPCRGSATVARSDESLQKVSHLESQRLASRHSGSDRILPGDGRKGPNAGYRRGHRSDGRAGLGQFRTTVTRHSRTAGLGQFRTTVTRCCGTADASGFRRANAGHFAPLP